MASLSALALDTRLMVSVSALRSRLLWPTMLAPERRLTAARDNGSPSWSGLTGVVAAAPANAASEFELATASRSTLGVWAITYRPPRVETRAPGAIAGVGTPGACTV